MPTLVDDLRTQVDSFFDSVAETAFDQALDAKLPLVGAALQTAAAGAIPVFAAIKGEILSVLDTAEDATSAETIASALDALDGVEATASDGKVLIHIGASDSYSPTPGVFDLSVGSDALGFTVKGTAGFALGAGLDVNLSYDTNAPGHVLTIVDKGSDELSLSITGSLALDDATGAKLGFLGVDVSDNLATPEIALNAAINITDGQSVAALGASSFSTSISGDANLNLGLTTNLSTDLLPKLLTDLVVKYHVDPFDPSTGLSGLGATPTISLDHIQLDLSSFVDFLAGVFGPIISDVFGSFPLQDLLDGVTAPIPVLDDATRLLNLMSRFDLAGPDDRITILDLAIAGGSDPALINGFATAFNLIKGITEATGAGEVGKIDLGSITLLGDSPSARLSAAAAAAGSGYNPPAGNPLQDAIDGLGDTLGGQPTPKDGLVGLLQPLVDVLDSVGVSIPLLSDPAGTIVPLLLNNISDPVDLIVYDVPPLGYEAGYEQFFPIIGPIGVGFEGKVFGGIDIKFGYDTESLKPGKSFSDGFFLSTEKLATPIQVGDETAFYSAAAMVGSTVAAYAGVNVGFASAGVYGGLRAGLEAYFPGADDDGKLRLSTIGEGCIFSPITGELGVEVYAKIKIGFSVFSFTRRFDIADVTLANFNFGCDPSTDPQMGLATLGPEGGVASGTFEINAGARAGLRSINGHVGTDGVEAFSIGNARDMNGVLVPGALAVNAFGLNEQYGSAANAATFIEAKMGNERDTIVVAADVTVDAHLEGNGGEDLVVGGGGNDKLYGGADGDHLIGGAGNDLLDGGDGDDVLEGGLGADIIEGGADRDQVSYEHSAEGVTFTYQNIDGRAGFVGTGGEAAGDVLYDVEYLIGSHFADTLNGNPNQENTLEGLDGNDILVGGGKSDFILGGGGADLMIGGGGEDATSYVSSSGQVVVNLQAGIGLLSDAAGDVFVSIEDVQGSYADDSLTGNDSDNKLDGWYGDDTLEGGGGHDEVSGGEGNDTVYGNADGDLLDGGGALTSPGRDLLSYARHVGGVTINLLTGGGDDTTARAALPPGIVLDGYSTFENLDGSNQDDTLTGDNQYNTIRGLAGADRINGASGDDRIEGGAGADALDGGSGIDLADYRNSPGAVYVNLATGLGFFSDASGDTLANIENLRGSDFADALFGGAALIGNDADNEIDPGLSRTPGVSDVVDGGENSSGTDVDTLVIDYSRRDTGLGLIGGFELFYSDRGSFQRLTTDGSAQLDGVSFSNIERLSVVGTAKADSIYGGAGNDIIITEGGNDTIVSGLGVDRVFAGAGDDSVKYGTDASRNLSLLGGTTFFQLDGGRGIDSLSVSLAAFTGPVNLRGTDGTAEFTGTNAILANGAAISNFETLGDVLTGRGDDTIIQPGAYNNVFNTGFGVDVITPGLGHDIINGGMDYRVGSEIFDPGAGYGSGYGQLYYDRGNATAILANDGDRLVLDYSSTNQAVTSSVSIQDTGYRFDGYFLGAGYGTEPIYSNQGVYRAGDDTSHEFFGIERLSVIGSNKNDQLVGTQLYLGRNQTLPGGDGTIVASTSARGDDILIGGDGDDRLFGRSGDDVLAGGNGADVLFGADEARGGIVDLGEVDRLTGGAGADTFVLGSISGTLYNDLATGYGNFSSNRFASTDNRAVITDFDTAEDKLALWTNSDHADAALYRVEERGGSTFLYLHDGLDVTGAPNAAHDELIAELVGVTGFRLDGAYVEYDQDFSDLAVVPAQTLDKSAARTMVATGAAADAAAVETHAAAAEAPSWVTQTADPDMLKSALFGAGFSALGQGNLEVDGNSAAFGTFSGDPFELGSGIVLSTGDVTELAGVNLVDGGLAKPQTVDISFDQISAFEQVGSTFGGATIYRADLSNLGIDLKSLVLGDRSAGFGGGGGQVSGFDIDALVLSNQKVDSFASLADFNNSATLSRLNVFDFNLAATQYVAGTQREGSTQYPNSSDLVGAVNSLPDFAAATLGTADADGFGHAGELTLGDGGSIGFDLNKTVSSDGPLYLYVVETGGVGGEKLTTGLTASDSRLDAPTDLSTDLGLPGVDGDTVSLTYTFTPTDVNGNVDNSVTDVAFDFVFFSEELVEFAQSEFNDDFKILLNGQNLARLSDGSFASVNSLYTPAAGPQASSDIFSLRTDSSSPSDFIYNPVGTGPSASETRADSYSKVLHFTAPILAGQQNVLTIQARDVRDGLLDSGILIRGSSLEGSSHIGFAIDRDNAPLSEGDQREIDFHLNLPGGTSPTGPVTVILDPTNGIDLGAGAGVAVTRVIDAGGPYDGSVIVTALNDGNNVGERTETVAVSVAGSGITDPVAPLLVLVDDVFETLTQTIGDAPTRYSRSAPNAWHDAWTAPGITITHTADHGGADVYSAVDFGTLNPGVLAGSDMLAGDLGVSGVAGGSSGVPQDIAGTEALRFAFASHDVGAFEIDFARFEIGDSALIEMFDAGGALVRTDTATNTSFDVSGLQNVASVVVSAASGAFMVDSVTVSERVETMPEMMAADFAEMDKAHHDIHMLQMPV